MTFQVFSSSQGHPSKPKNGDHAGHDFLPGPGGLVLAVSDGVSSHDYDWQASKTTCEACLLSLSETKGTPEKRLRRAMESAQDAVQSLRGLAQGAKATLLLAVFDESQGRCSFFSIGDSRIYKVGGQGTELLTVDDARSIVLKQGGEMLLQDGAVVFRRVLTQAIGQANPLEMKVQSTVLKPGELLAFATDGCYELAGFLGRLKGVQQYSDLEAAAQSLVMDHHLKTGSDDGTLAIIRRIDCPEDLAEVYLNAFDDEVSLVDSPLIGHTMLKIIMKQMQDWARIPDSGNLERGLSFLQKEKLKPGREAGIAILDEFENDSSPEATQVFRQIAAWVKCL